MILRKFVVFINYPITLFGSLLETITLVKSDDTLNFLCYLFYYILYLSQEAHDIWSWDYENAFIQHGNKMLPAIPLLAGYSIHVKNMHERNYTQYQIDKHKQNVCRKIMNDYYSLNGLSFRHMVWLSIFVKCNIIEIGRLQYNYHPTTNLSYLSEAKYHIELHIPEGNPLGIEEVKQSLADAPKYIYSYFNLDFNVELEYYVESWLLSPELKYLLNENSNILNFQKLFHIVNYEENIKDFMRFVFQLTYVPKDFSVLKEATSLQRNMKNYLLEGNKLHIGTAILK